MLTSPTLVGSVAVEIEMSARGFARRLRKAVQDEFKNLDLEKSLSAAIGNKPIRVPVRAEWVGKLPALPTQNAPRSRPERQAPAPDNTDSVMRAFRADVQRELRALARQVVKIPVVPDNDRLRGDLTDAIDNIEKRLRVEVPAAPGDRREYERELRRMVDGVAARVQMVLPAPKVKEPKPVRVPVRVDPLTRVFQQEIQREITRLSRLAHAKIPIGAETERFRAQAARAVAEVERALKAEVPTEPGDRAGYEARLRAMVAAASRTVRASIPVDVDHNRFQRAIADLAARLPQSLGGALQQVGNAANQASGAVMAAMGAAAASLTSLVNPATMAAVAIGITVAGLLSIGPAAGAAAVAIGVLAGALAALPALTVMGLGTFGALGFALKGMGAAFKDAGKAAGGGGGKVAAAGQKTAASQRAIAAAQRGLAAATRALANAQREELAAQRAINDARKEAAERLDDLARALRGAQLDEEDALIRVKEAEKNLARAEMIGTPRELERARQELKRARHDADLASDRVSDLAKEKADADKRGVEGSKEVTAAIEKHRRAQEAVLSAQESLISAQESLAAANERVASSAGSAGGGIGRMAKDMVKIAPAAQRFVDAVKRLGPAFTRLRLEVQDRFFAGLDVALERVATVWLPRLKDVVGGFADVINGILKELTVSVTKPQFVSDIVAAAGVAQKALARIGGALVGPFMDAFGRLARASEPFVMGLADGFGRMIERFADWVKSADESGALQKFFKDVTGYLRDFGRFGKAVGSIFASLTKILFGADQSSGGSGVLDMFERLAEWLKDPENQESMARYIAAFQKVSDFLLNDLIPAITKTIWFISTVNGRINSGGKSIKDTFNRVKDTVTGFVSSTGRILSALPGKVGDWLRALPGRLSAIFSAGVNRAGQIVGRGLGRIARFFADLPGNLATALQNLGPTLHNIMTRAVDRAVRALRELAPRGERAATDLVERLRTGLVRLGALAFEAGEDLVRGLWNGILSLQAWLGRQIANFAAGVIKGFREGFDSKSPSRKMIEVGVTLPQGLAVGMKAEIRKVISARDALVAAATPDLAKAYARSLADGLGDLLPAITGVQAPVPAVAGGGNHFEAHLHNSQATLGQLEALQRRQAVLARIGRPR